MLSKIAKLRTCLRLPYSRQTRRSRIQHPMSACEALEERLVLSAAAWQDIGNLSISFAPDGTDVGGHANNMTATFENLGDPTVWQQTIISAVETWTAELNASLLPVSDNGNGFGDPGLIGSDPGFGDIRVAAIPLAPDVFALSVPHDHVVSGSWSGDILFNSQLPPETLDELFALSLHESGHVLGLQHSEDELSPMFEHGGKTIMQPTVADVKNLYELYGEPEGNDPEPDSGSGTANAASVGPADLDVDADGEFLPLTDGIVVLRYLAGFTGDALIADAINENGERSDPNEIEDLLDGMLAQLDVDGDAQQNALTDGIVLLRYAAGFSGEQLVSGAINDTGNRADALAIEGYIERTQARYGQSSPIARSLELQTTNGFGLNRHFIATSEIDDPNQIDVYGFVAAESDTGAAEVATIVVQTGETGSLVATVSLLDENLFPIETTVLSNGNGRMVIQAPDVRGHYNVVVAPADPQGIFSTGSYEVSISFGKESFELDTFSEGKLDAENPVAIHSLYLATPQLVNLSVVTEEFDAPDSSAILVSVYDDQDQLVLRTSARSEELRSVRTTLFRPGEYRIVVQAVTETGELESELRYNLAGSISSIQVGPLPSDPTGLAAYQCPDSPNYCYPTGTVSAEPHHVATDPLVTQPPITDPTWDEVYQYYTWWDGMLG